MSEESAFLAAILADPDDDGPRLVYADWLDERGEVARAEFIRVQCELAGDPHDDGPRCGCHWCRLRRRVRELLDGVCGLGVEALPVLEGWTRTNCATLGKYGWSRRSRPEEVIIAEFRRGFVEAITLTVARFLGGPCPGCVNSPEPGWVHRHGENGPGYYPCRGCTDIDNGERRGTGRLPGLAADLARATPLREVRLSDREPERVRVDSFGWWDESQRWHSDHVATATALLPAILWSLIQGHKRQDRNCKSFDSPDAARAALSAACVALARKRVEVAFRES